MIFNAFNISLNERTQQIGILASVGATPKQIASSVLYEGLCIGAVGIPIGVLAGLGAIQGVISAVAGSFGNILGSDLQLKLWVSVPVLIGAVLISLITILIAALLPAKKAAKTPVIECIRQTGEIKVTGKAVKTSKLSEKIWGLEGTLALKNFKRNKKQYRSIVLSLVLSIVLFVTTSSFVDCLTTISDSAKMVTDYDIGFGTQEMRDTQLFECVFYGLRAFAWGLPISMTLSYIVQKLMLDGVTPMGTSWFQVPWFPLGIVAVLLLLFVTMMYTVNKLGRENIIDALRDEMT